MRKQKKDKFILGVTGSFASGKSTVARLFSAKNTQVIDADKIAHFCLNSDRMIKQKVFAAFGPAVIGPGGVILRKELGKIVFSNKIALKKLNRIIHPVLKNLIAERIKSSSKKIVILDAALIVEAGLKGWLDKLVVVKADPKQQVLRGKKKFSLSPMEALARIKSQSSIRAKSRLADFIIDNRGTLQQTKKQVAEIRRKLWKS
jgi:dephospho-CoA kinase